MHPFRWLTMLIWRVINWLIHSHWFHFESWFSFVIFFSRIMYGKSIVAEFDRLFCGYFNFFLSFKKNLIGSLIESSLLNVSVRLFPFSFTSPCFNVLLHKSISDDGSMIKGSDSDSLQRVLGVMIMCLINRFIHVTCWL